jgi:hypothetical protein
MVSKEQSFRHPHTRLSPDELRKGAALALSIAFKGGGKRARRLS